MLAKQRQRLILDRLEHDGAVAVSTLAREWRISRETVRRDINHLAAAGRVVKTHGGALSVQLREPDIAERGAVNAAGKRAIAMTAAALVPDGASLILDSGTTTRKLAEALTEKRELTVYTNDLEIVRLLGRRKGNRVLVLGGELQAHEDSISGIDAADMLGRYVADFAFVGAGGFAADGCLTDYSRDAAMMRSTMFKAGRAAALLADHTKFVRVTPVKVPGFERARWIVVDQSPPPALASVWRGFGVEILQAKAGRGK